MLGVTGNSPSSCLCHVMSGGLSLQFFKKKRKKRAVLPDWHLLCTKGASSTAVQELSRDKGNAPRDTSGERSGWQKYRHSACHHWGAEDKPGSRPLTACAAVPPSPQLSGQGRVAAHEICSVLFAHTTSSICIRRGPRWTNRSFLAWTNMKETVVTPEWQVGKGEKIRNRKKNSWDVTGTMLGRVHDHWFCLERVLKPSLCFAPTRTSKLLGSSHRIPNTSERWIV